MTTAQETPPKPAATAARTDLRSKLASVDQAVLIAGVTAVMVVFGAIFVDGMFSFDNLATVARISAPMGILAVASALVIMGKNVDLSVVAVVGVAGMVTVHLAGANGFSEWQAILAVLAIGVFVGLANGWLSAYVGIPALFVTLGTWKLVEGYFNVTLLDKQSYSLPADFGFVKWLGQGSVLGLDVPILLAVLTFAGAAWALNKTSFGSMLRATGDSPAAARLTGLPVRSLIVATFVIAAVLAVVVGLMQLGINGGYSKAYGAGDELMFNAITAAVIGGVSLTGGKGSISGVLAGVAFIAIFTNMMTLLDVSVVTSTAVRGAILLSALALDAWLHPRDEETAKSDDL